jgi:hypothetical protein
MALDPEAWHELFATVAAASAALLGLFVVAITLHLRMIAEHPIARNQARVVLTLLGLTLMFSLTDLFPGVTSSWLASELLVITAVLLAVYIAGLLRAWRAGVEIPRAVWERAPIIGVTTVLFLAGGVSLLANQGPGLYLVAPVFVMAMPLAVWSAWSLIMRDDSTSSRVPEPNHGSAVERPRQRRQFARTVSTERTPEESARPVKGRN